MEKPVMSDGVVSGVHWILANDSDTAEFQLYRGDELIYAALNGKRLDRCGR